VVENLKPYRELRLTSPFTHGNDVKAVQRRLKVLVDGEFGPATASAVAAWKRRAGYPVKKINPMIGITGQKYLFGQKKLPPAFQLRAKLRARAERKRRAELAKLRSVQQKTLATMTLWADAGFKEVPAYSNKVPPMQDIARRMGLSSFYVNMGWPWCAFATFLAALMHDSKAAHAGLRKGQFNALYTVDILYHAQQNNFGMRIVGKSEVKPGDFAMFNFPGGDPRVDHIGIVKQAPVNDWFVAVEGNTSASGSQTNGGAMLIKTRPINLVTAFIRFE
jgi:hypothetical protein